MRVVNISIRKNGGNIMDIKIVGTGCAKCVELEKRVRIIVEDMGIDAEINKISKIDEIAKTGILMTPGLIIDDNVKTTGKLPSIEELTKIIEASL